MVEAMLMLLHPDENRIEGLGSHEFRVMPRVGEHISRNVDEVGQLYRVVAVHHPSRPAATAGDIFIVHVGSVLDNLQRLKGNKYSGE